MEARHLIELLSKLPPDARITVQGYEGGLNDVADVQSVEVVLYANPEVYYGDHMPVLAWMTQVMGNEEAPIDMQGHKTAMVYEIIGRRKDGLR